MYIDITGDKKESLFAELEDDFEFDIDISKGLYLGSGLSLIGDKEERTVVKPLFVDWKKLAGHLSVYGTTRVGKTRLMVAIIRQCILKGMDILLVEPKGAVGEKRDAKGKDLGIGQETLSWITQFAQEAGRIRDIRYISPKFHEISMKFNPLFGLTNEEIASLVSTIIPADDPFFVGMGYQITMAVLQGLEFLESKEGKDQIKKILDEEYRKVYSSGANIINEKLGISDPDLATRITTKKLSSSIENSIPPYRSLVTFADLAKYSTLEGVQFILKKVVDTREEDYNIANAKDLEEVEIMREEALRSLVSMANQDKNYYSKVTASFNIVLQQLSSGELGKIFCSVKINPLLDGLYSESRSQIIIIQPWPLIYKEASTAFVRIFFSVITSFFGNIGASGRAAYRELAMFVDEGGAVLYEGVQDLFNKGGGLGLRIFIFTQSFSDYKSSLGEDVAAIINDNTNIKLYMRMNDQSSKELVAEAFGPIKVRRSQYMGSKLDMRISSAEEEIELLTATHVAKLKEQEFLLQYGDGLFYCCAPFQPDPNMLFSMPEVQLEKTFKQRSKDYVSEIEEETEIVISKEEN